VPVNFGNLRHPKRDMLWVAAAGPLSNLAMAVIWGAVLKISAALPGTYFALPLALMGAAGVFVNVIFMVLNLLPLPPLDGGRILVSVLPHRIAYNVARVEPYGFFVIIALLAAGVLGAILGPPIRLTVLLIETVLGLAPGVVFQLAAAI
jgi:Zn-dependent protease